MTPDGLIASDRQQEKEIARDVLEQLHKERGREERRTFQGI